MPAVRAGQWPVLARNDPLKIFGNQRQQSLLITAVECRKEVLHSLDVLFDAHRNLSFPLHQSVSDIVERFVSYRARQITRSRNYCCFLNRSWKMSGPQTRPRACTSKPPSLSFPRVTGANPSLFARSATGAIASSSSLDKKMTRWPPSTTGSLANVAAPRWLKPFTTLAPVKDFAMKVEDGRPSSSSGGSGNEFIASMTVLPFQLGSAFASSRCSPNGTAKMIVSASSASRSDMATTVDPIARACGATTSAGRRLATVTLMFFGRTRGRGPDLSFRILQLHSS